MSPNLMMFPLQITEDGDRTTVRFPTGTALSESNAEELGYTLTALVDARPHGQLLVDLAGVTMMTSVILSKFIALNNRVRVGGGRLTLLNSTPVVRTVFKVTRLDTILEVRDVSEADAALPA